MQFGFQVLFLYGSGSATLFFFVTNPFVAFKDKVSRAENKMNIGRGYDSCIFCSKFFGIGLQSGFIFIFKLVLQKWLKVT